MSHAVVFLATPQFLPAGLGLGAAAVGVGVTALACYGSYLALRQLCQEYQCARAEFAERSQADEFSRRSSLEQQQHAAIAALALSEQTKQHAVQNASVAFIRQRVQQLTQRLPTLPDTGPDLPARCAALLEAIDQVPGNLAVHLEEYHRLAAQIAELTANQATDRTRALREEIAAVRAEIEAPLLAGESDGPLREQLHAQLTSLEQAVTRQPKMARQGVALLRARIKGEVQARLEQQEAAQAKAREMRSLVGDTVARLQALANLHALPEQSRLAAPLLQRLSTLLTSPGPDDEAAIRELAQEVACLYIACEKILEERTMAAFLGDQISDVLLSMGYRVAQIPGETPEGAHSLVASLDDHVGVEFRVNGDGKLGSLMVALSDDAVQTGEEHEESVCRLVDRVLEALQSRQCQVRERYRAILAQGDELRMVHLPAEKQAERRGQAVKHRVFDEPYET